MQAGHSYTNVIAGDGNSHESLFSNEATTLSVVRLPRGNTRTTVSGPFGETLRTSEADNLSRASETQTTYARGPFGMVSNVIGPHGTTHYGRDDWGRVLESTDPAMGTRTFAYSGFDEVLQETDARDVIDLYDYDALGRLVDKRNFEGEVIAHWDYDGAGPNERGRLVGSWRRAGPDSNTGTWMLNRYAGPGGLPSSVTHHIGAELDDPEGGELFTTEYLYDPVVPGRLSGISYPTNGGGFRIGYDYDASGTIQSVFPTDNVGNPTADPPFWTLLEADQGYRLGKEEFGNGMVSMRSYYRPGDCPANGSSACSGQLRNIITQGESPNRAQSLEYHWDPNGNLRDFFPNSLNRGISETYVYDGHDRLDSVQHNLPGNPSSITDYDYDSAGNLTFQTSLGAYNYDPPTDPSRQLRNAGDTDFLYDPNGNMTERIGPLAKFGYQKLDYNDFDMPYHVQSGMGPTPNHTDLEYTAGGQRVVQHDSTPAFTTTRVFIGDLYERFTQPFGTPPEHRYKILVGSRQVAEVSRSTSHPEEVFYLHDDHLGSVTVISDQDGSGGESRVYGTFGERVSGSGATGVLAAYTGHNDDTSLGLVNMRGRIYDQKLGRFLTPDPFVANPRNSQGWNRYAYVQNNPLKFVDPSGFQGMCIDASQETGGEAVCPSQPDDDSELGMTVRGQAPTNDEAYEDARRAEAQQRQDDAVSSMNNMSQGQGQNQCTLSDAQSHAPNSSNPPRTSNISPRGGAEGASGQVEGSGGTGPAEELPQPHPLPCAPTCGDEVGDIGRLTYELALLKRLNLPATPRSVTAEEAIIAGELRVEVEVVHFTNLPGVMAIERAGSLRAGTYVTVPSEVAGLSARGIERGLEIAPGRGTVGTTFVTPQSNLVTPLGGPTTSGGLVQYQLVSPTAPGTFIPYR